MKRFIMLAFMQVATLLSFSQEISIGDAVPDISLEEFYGSPGKKMSFRELKGKIIILDFWNVRCSACLTNMPRLDSLQSLFGDKIQIFLVTQNSEIEVKKLFQKIAKPVPRLPMIINDTLLYQMFPHTGDPFHAWIGPDGKVAALTNHENTNLRTIGNALNGLPIKLPRRYNTSVDPGELLISEKNKMFLELTYYHSALFRNIFNYSAGVMVRIRNNESDGTGISTINTTIPVLYHIAYNRTLFGFEISNFDLMRNNRIFFETKNPNKFFRPADPSEIAAWDEENKLSYELNVPAKDSDLVYQYMQEDLNRYLPYEASLEKRVVNCLVLVRTSERDSLKSKDTSLPASRNVNKDRSISIKNMPLQTALLKPMIIAFEKLSTPVIDGTHYRGLIDIEMNAKLKTVEDYRKNLAKYDLDLKVMKKEILILVIKDKKHKTTD